MDWFSSLEGPTQVAMIGVLSALVIAGGTVLVAAINNWRKAATPPGTSSIAAMAIDSTAVLAVASALEAMNMTLMAQNKLSGELMAEASAVTRELEELRRVLDRLGDRMASRK
jgi:hypothetical protein